VYSQATETELNTVTQSHEREGEDDNVLVVLTAHYLNGISFEKVDNKLVGELQNLHSAS